MAKNPTLHNGCKIMECVWSNQINLINKCILESIWIYNKFEFDGGFVAYRISETNL